MGEFKYLDVADVEYLHRYTIAKQGGSFGLRDRGLLESAVAMPRQQFGGVDLHPTLAAKAAAYLFHLTSNHPFVDGNKRVGLLAAMAFVRSNGVNFSFENLKLEKITLAVASGDMNKQALTAWFENELGHG